MNPIVDVVDDLLGAATVVDSLSFGAMNALEKEYFLLVYMLLISVAAAVGASSSADLCGMIIISTEDAGDSSCLFINSIEAVDSSLEMMGGSIFPLLVLLHSRRSKDDLGGSIVFINFVEAVDLLEVGGGSTFSRLVVLVLV